MSGGLGVVVVGPLPVVVPRVLYTEEEEDKTEQMSPDKCKAGTNA